ncbi:putative phospho-adenylylsulfate sulfotransferase [[Clostridium] ultunense Esp]|uniref:phosphoadenylyl-sulfate reductase n=1 Tax=Thermicanus aegyptius TaxID=94009 RepID=UPI0002B7089A|nr:phosphoadenylyl-sulfate reductase [Thermicanus aegyptius]CCQ94872.1 putative phospho-adenylylsulfate sulfotransferase [[Clostridium] ultunense Esp]
MDHDVYEHYTALELIHWAWEKYGSGLTFASSFGKEDLVILDLLMRHHPQVDIFFLDTDLHFQETYGTISRLETHYGRTFTRVKPFLSLKEQTLRHGEALWSRDPDFCCNLRKVEPLKKYLSSFSAWITGIRREQSPTRAHMKKVEWDRKFQLVKMNPLVDWTEKEVWSYIMERNLPYNPLHDRNYPSIGCAVCTRPVKQGEGMRSGRWSGFNKVECGLHQ